MHATRVCKGHEDTDLCPCPACLEDFGTYRATMLMMVEVLSVRVHACCLANATNAILGYVAEGLLCGKVHIPVCVFLTCHFSCNGGGLEYVCIGPHLLPCQRY
jgi:hypothetical protein